MDTSLLLIAFVLAAGIVTIVLLHRRRSGGLDSRLQAIDATLERTDRQIQTEFRANRCETAETVQRLGQSLVQSQNALGESQNLALDRFSTQLATNTRSSNEQLTQLRNEVSHALQGSAATTVRNIADLSKLSVERLDALSNRLATSVQAFEERSAAELAGLRTTLQTAFDGLADRVTRALSEATESQGRRVIDLSVAQEQQWNGFRTQVETLRSSVEAKVDALRTDVGDRLREIQQDNAIKLDQMRQTVDEKLQTTLEARLGESFRQVREQLEQVYKGLGEMQALATGVGDLKRVLTNVKVRGTWGEVQLSTLLEQVLAPDQYAKNVATNENGGERVEFAIRLPGRSGNDHEQAWLPIDAKFPLEDYHALNEAADRADAVAREEAARRLEARIKASAKDISVKYLNPPKTTDFALMFIPNEGLYAEVLRRPGLADYVQRECRVVIAGPTTLWAILNSLQLGFRTLAIERRSSEVYELLGAVKTEFGKFGKTLGRIQKNLNHASTNIDVALRGTRSIERRLRDVQELPAAEAAGLLDGVVMEALDDDERLAS